MAGSKLRSLVMILSAAFAVALGSVAATAGAAAPAKWIVFSATQPGQHIDQLFRIRSSGGGLKRLTKGQFPSIAPAFSPDGTRIAFTRTGVGIVTMNVDGKDVRRLTTNGRDSFPTWSPDGKQIAFLRPASTWSIYVMSSSGASAATVGQGASGRSPDVELRRAHGPLGRRPGEDRPRQWARAEVLRRRDRRRVGSQHRLARPPTVRASPSSAPPPRNRATRNAATVSRASGSRSTRKVFVRRASLVYSSRTSARPRTHPTGNSSSSSRGTPSSTSGRSRQALHGVFRSAATTPRSPRLRRGSRELAATIKHRSRIRTGSC